MTTASKVLWRFFLTVNYVRHTLIPVKSYTENQLNYVRESGRILSGALSTVAKAIKPGISTFELDSIAERYIRDHGGEPSFKGYNGFLFSICASINEECIHGIPGKNRVLSAGDIISVDCGVRYPKGKGGMCADAARTFAVGKISDEACALIKVTEECFKVAVKDLKAGDEVGTIGKKIEAFIDGRYGIIDKYFGHGTGERVHEEPLIPHFDVTASNNHKLEKIAGIRLTEGMIICIEPMINLGTKDVKLAEDGWTVVTLDGRIAAHYEQTLIIHNDKVEIVT